VTILERRVRLRAGGRCEYCHMPEEFEPLSFHIDHVIARQHRGRTSFANLALCCSFCNLKKGPNLAGIDPRSGQIVPLFNPRRHKWHRHFRWFGPRLIGLTPAARATIVVLAINEDLNISTRRSLMVEGLFEK